jgi:hypothetical protein
LDRGLEPSCQGSFNVDDGWRGCTSRFVGIILVFENVNSPRRLS